MSLLYSFANFKRTLQKFVTDKIGKVLGTGLSKGAYWVRYTVVYANCKICTCVTFVSVKWLKYSLVELRKLGAQSVELQKVSPTAWAANTSNDIYFVHTDDGLTCTCQDYQNQMVEFGRACCKHGYAVLNQLGFTSLQKFLDKNRWGS